ncbi:MAG: Crp/Fnr family transcriptional regulator [Actinomycetes bacterium]
MTSTDDLAATLGGVDLFAGLPAKVFRRFEQDGVRSTFAAGELVTHEGDKVGGFVPFSQGGVLFHVVLAGSGEVRRDGAAVGQVGPGDYFGELSLIDDGPRTADVVAGPDGMETFALTKWTFGDLLEEHPEVAVPMLRVMTARLRRCEAAQRQGG